MFRLLQKKDKDGNYVERVTLTNLENDQENLHIVSQKIIFTDYAS